VTRVHKTRMSLYLAQSKPAPNVRYLVFFSCDDSDRDSLITALAQQIQTRATRKYSSLFIFSCRIEGLLHRRGWELHVVYTSPSGRHDRTCCRLCDCVERQQSSMSPRHKSEHSELSWSRRSTELVADAVTFRPGGRAAPSSTRGETASWHADW
jgi:hypothetical protein